MKKYFIYAVSALLALAACTSDDLVDKAVVNGLDSKADNVMSFAVNNKNMSRAPQAMEKLGIYGFGVWGLKSFDNATKPTQTVFDNCLVGYYDEANGRGYYGADASTIGDKDKEQNGYSMWFYEGLGSSQYTVPTGTAYKNYIGASTSKNGEQYLKYWDKESKNVEFFAYTPYKLSNDNKIVFDKTAKTMTVGTLWAGFDKPEENEYLLSYKNVEKANYDQDVQLTFKRINAKVRLTFYEKIAGYKVQIDNVTLTNAHNDGKGKGVVADDDKITVGGSFKAEVAGTDINITPVVGSSVQSHFADLGKYGKPYYPGFGVPEQTEVAAGADAKHPGLAYKYITEKRDEAVTDDSKSMCPHVYYAMPASTETGKANSGFNVTVDFTLISEDTDETMEIKDATVFVDDDYTQWASNTNYLYVFRITKDATDPSGDPLLKPIVFDGIQVDEYNDGEWNTNDWIINAEDNPTAAISCSLPNEIAKGKYTEFTVTNYVQPAITDKVYAKITVSDATLIAATDAAGDYGLQFYQTNPKATVGWTNFGAPTGKVYTFMEGTGFTIEDGVPLKLRIKPIDTAAPNTSFTATIEIIKVCPEAGENPLVTSCDVKTIINKVVTP